MAEEPWTKSWEGIEKELIDCNIKNFRRNPKIYTRIESPNGRDKLEKACKKEGVPLQLIEENEIGAPKNVKKYCNVSTTINSLRFGYTAHRILCKIKKNISITALEVGPGYGGLAHKLIENGNIKKYHLIDNEVMYKLQKYYLGELGCLDKCEFSIPTKQVDLIISIHSLGEMDQKEIAYYINIFESVLKPNEGLLYLVQHEKNRPNRIGFANYPFKKNWHWDIYQTPYKPKQLNEYFGRLKSK